MNFINNIKVSVIMPVYNAEKYLKKCLDSVVNQSLKEIEIICVDDGSTDNSLNILNEYKNNDSRFKILTQKNLFAGCARNNGMKIAKGKYFVFWDSDDFFEKDALALLYDKCEKKTADICLCGAFRYDTQKGTKALDESFLKKRFLPKEKVFSKDTFGKYIFNVASNNPWQRMFRADFVRQHNIEFQNIRQSNDTYFVMMAMFYAKRITVIEKALVNYRVNNAQSITGKVSKDPLCAYKSLSAVYEKLKDENPTSEVWQSFYNKLIPALIRNITIQTTENGIETVYNKIKDEGLTYFDIVSHLDSSYYYFKGEYEDLMFLKDHTISEFLLYKYQKASDNLNFYKSQKEKNPIVKLARKLSRFINVDSAIFEKGKKLLHLK